MKAYVFCFLKMYTLPVNMASHPPRNAPEKCFPGAPKMANLEKMFILCARIGVWVTL